jgi:hypothetical protein
MTGLGSATAENSASVPAAQEFDAVGEAHPVTEQDLVTDKRGREDSRAEWVHD